MAVLRVVDDELRIELSRWEKIGALSGDLVFPLTSIVSVERVDTARSSIRGMRAPGTGLPGRLALGRWRGRGSVDFVAAYRDDPGYVVDLTGEPVNRLIISSPRVDELDALM
jgi:hypothetical protein